MDISLFAQNVQHVCDQIEYDYELGFMWEVSGAGWMTAQIDAVPLMFFARMTAKKPDNIEGVPPLCPGKFTTPPRDLFRRVALDSDVVNALQKYPSDICGYAENKDETYFQFLDGTIAEHTDSGIWRP